MINAVLKEPLKLSVLNVIGGGDQAWAVVELEAKGGICKNGMTFNDECWLVELRILNAGQVCRTSNAMRG